MDPAGFAAPLRARLAEIAAAALSELPAEDVPQLLRPVARFAPAKRAKAGEQALLRALAESRFRARVRAWVEDQHADWFTVTDQDAVGAAATAVLTDDPYAPYLVELVRRRAEDTGARAERDRARAKLERLQRELADARRQRRTAPGDEEHSETDKLRARLREKGSQLRAARDEADAASAALAEVRGETELEVKRIAAERDAERSRAVAERARADRAQRDAEAARLAARQARAADDSRLALLVQTLEGAVTGLRGELSLSDPTSSGPTTRPADTVARASAARPTSSALTDPDALDDVLRLPAAHLIVDGYNVTKTGYPELPLAEQRDRLARQLAALGARTGAEITVVFDGAGVTAHKTWPRGVRVLFSDPDVLADDVIRDLVAAEPYGRPLMVATADREVIEAVRARRAHVVSSTVLLRRLGRV